MNKWVFIDTTYVYDGTFEGLLSVIEKILKTKVIPYHITNKNNYVPNIFNNIQNIEVNDEYLLLIRYLKQNYIIYNNIYLTFHSRDLNKEMIILKYIIYYNKYKDELLNMKHLDIVMNLNKILNDVAHECHKYKGFLRFKELNNKVLYAEFEPKNDVITLIFSHFKTRLANEIFIINDVFRNKAIIYYKKDFMFLDSKTINRDILIKSQDEKQYSNMWKSFFKTIAIKDRINKKNQMSFMPKRFWGYLTEMEKDDE